MVTRLRSQLLVFLVSLLLEGGRAGAMAASPPAPTADCQAEALSAATASSPLEPASAPPDLATVTAEPPYREEEETDQIRLASVRQSALSLGMRAGFARGIWCHQREIERLAARLDHAYDFRALLFEAGGGFLYEPGIVLEESDDRAVQDGGARAAAAAARILLTAHEQLVSRPRNWRQYLLVDIEPLTPEHPANRPRSEDREPWRAWVAEGWRLGVRQASDTMDELWNQLDRDYVGMVTYRRLLLEHKLEPPKALVTDRGVTGGAAEVRVGDVEVRTQKPGRLDTAPARWQPLPFVGPDPVPHPPPGGSR